MNISNKIPGQPGSASLHRTPDSPKRGLMSGETLRAPRQQLRLLRASGFRFSYSKFLRQFHFSLGPPVDNHYKIVPRLKP